MDLTEFPPKVKKNTSFVMFQYKHSTNNREKKNIQCQGFYIFAQIDFFDNIHALDENAENVEGCANYRQVTLHILFMREISENYLHF